MKNYEFIGQVIQSKMHDQGHRGADSTLSSHQPNSLHSPYVKCNSEIRSTRV